ncbi:hypothetical protein [Actinomadura sp. NPDC049753]|uniref:hypothetical protein n=1 Tax=Actinomadura sp. NPDC049753 TaxID=3154739 RepID=UPI003429A827
MAATLHAQLAGQTDEHLRRLRGLDKENVQSEYPILIAAAFFLATNRRFSKSDPTTVTSQIIDFVASLRARTPEATEKVDAHIAERLLRAVLGEGSIADIDDSTVYTTELFLLAGLISDANLTDAELTAFIAKARAMADEG